MDDFSLTVILVVVAIVAFVWWGTYQPACNDLVGDRNIDEWLLRSINLSLLDYTDAPHPVVAKVGVLSYESREVMLEPGNYEELFRYIATNSDGRVGTSRAR